MKNLFISFLFFMICMAAVQGQVMMKIHKSDGSVEQIPVSDIDRVNFTSTPPPPSLQVSPTEGNTLTVALNEIDSITYSTPPEGTTVTDIDGHVYETVTIGPQVWMKENLRTTRYRDGSTIPNVTDNGAWGSLAGGAWCHYNNNTAHDATHGKLYNWYAVADPSGLCPTGWHVPSDDEWKTLELSLGMHPSEVNETGRRGEPANVGGSMKAVTGWDAPNNGATNSSGFTALPGGVRNNSGGFVLIGGYGSWWSATQATGTTAWVRILSYFYNQVERNSDPLKQIGYSVRCLKD